MNENGMNRFLQNMREKSKSTTIETELTNLTKLEQRMENFANSVDYDIQNFTERMNRLASKINELEEKSNKALMNIVTSLETHQNALQSDFMKKSKEEQESMINIIQKLNQEFISLKEAISPMKNDLNTMLQDSRKTSMYLKILGKGKKVMIPILGIGIMLIGMWGYIWKNNLEDQVRALYTGNQMLAKTLTSVEESGQTLTAFMKILQDKDLLEKKHLELANLEKEIQNRLKTKYRVELQNKSPETQAMILRFIESLSLCGSSICLGGEEVTRLVYKDGKLYRIKTISDAWGQPYTSMIEVTERKR